MWRFFHNFVFNIDNNSISKDAFRKQNDAVKQQLTLAKIISCVWGIEIIDWHRVPIQKSTMLFGRVIIVNNKQSVTVIDTKEEWKMLQQIWFNSILPPTIINNLKSTLLFFSDYPMSWTIRHLTQFFSICFQYPQWYSEPLIARNQPFWSKAIIYSNLNI